MRHKKAGRKFGRSTSHRRAMFRNLAANLVMYERIETTDAKAKELRRIAERLLTRAIRLGDDLTVDEGKLKDAIISSQSGDSNKFVGSIAYDVKLPVVFYARYCFWFFNCFNYWLQWNCF